jgi:hypothetical protein
MSIRLLKNARLLKFPSSFAVQRTSKYASRLRISGALHPDLFEQPAIFLYLRSGNRDFGVGPGRMAIASNLQTL